MLMSLDKHNSRSDLMVEQLVGTHVSFWEHLKKTTSPPFELLEASDNIVHLFEGQKNICFSMVQRKKPFLCRNPQIVRMNPKSILTITISSHYLHSPTGSTMPV